MRMMPPLRARRRMSVLVICTFLGGNFGLLKFVCVGWCTSKLPAFMSYRKSMAKYGTITPDALGTFIWLILSIDSPLAARTHFRMYSDLIRLKLVSFTLRMSLSQ